MISAAHPCGDVDSCLCSSWFSTPNSRHPSLPFSLTPSSTADIHQSLLQAWMVVYCSTVFFFGVPIPPGGLAYHSQRPTGISRISKYWYSGVFADIFGRATSIDTTAVFSRCRRCCIIHTSTVVQYSRVWNDWRCLVLFVVNARVTGCDSISGRYNR